MTTTFNAAATKTVGVNATNFEFTFTRLERMAFGPGKITTLGAELERMGATRARRFSADNRRPSSAEAFAATGAELNALSIRSCSRWCGSEGS
ncbi:MAG TPA: hypothetical protein VK635_02730 [Bradyrhizobium sp.]|jgi:hypothetical protein|nr:hypothetical protein [Bradyrhizobium sp.]